MNAADVLATLRYAGLTVSADDRGLIVKPKAKLRPELAELARGHKPGLLALLRPWAGQWPQRYDTLIVPGFCVECGEPAPRDGVHRCAACGDRLVRSAGRRGAMPMPDKARGPPANGRHRPVVAITEAEESWNPTP